MEPVYLAKREMDPSFPFKIYRREGRMQQELHAHDYIQLWFVQRGSCIHQFNRRRYFLIRGDCFILPPGIVHAVQSDSEETVLLGLEFTEAFLCGGNDFTGAVLSATEFVTPFLVTLDQVQPQVSLGGDILRGVELLFEETLQEFQNRGPLCELFIQANLLKILAMMLRERQRRSADSFCVAARHRMAVARTLDYIHEHFAEKIYLQELCMQAALSPTYYTRIFRTVTGSSFTEYVQSLRVQKAKSLLDSDQTVESIAIAVGYPDTASFDRAFKKATGVSPLQYRKSVQNLINSVPEKQIS